MSEIRSRLEDTTTVVIHNDTRAPGEHEVFITNQRGEVSRIEVDEDDSVYLNLLDAIDAVWMCGPGTDPCVSGVVAPAGLSDGGNHYCVAHCGYVVRYPAGRWDEIGKPAVQAHDREHHPAKYEQDRINEAMSRD